MKKLDKSFISAVLVLLGLYVVYYLITGAFIPCIIKKITHLYCPGCGLTRMIISLLKLNFYQAFRYNPLLFILLILSIIYNIIKFIINNFSTKKIKLNNYIYIFLLILTIGFGIIRNIPYFGYLIPTVVK
ncbi:MAG: DUF2752 domain-containing protein [Erysipelotrichales bacterium]|nr:DUF2752 domain-containing protein [Erysipelotrichales bacterium]